MTIDPRLERSILAEFALQDRRARRHRRTPASARALAERLHHGRHDLLAHLQRVAAAVPWRFRPVAWLHHAHDEHINSSALGAAGLTRAELQAIDLLAGADPATPRETDLARLRTIAAAPGRAGYFARVVARAALADRLAGMRPAGDGLAGLAMLANAGLGS